MFHAVCTVSNIVVYKRHCFAQRTSDGAISRNDAQRTPMEGLGSSNLGCPWAPKPHVHLPTQKLVLGSFYRDDAVKASTCLHETRLACGSGSLSLGTYDAPTSYNLLKFIDIRPLLRDAHFFLRGQRVANH